MVLHQPGSAVKVHQQIHFAGGAKVRGDKQRAEFQRQAEAGRLLAGQARVGPGGVGHG